MAEHHPESIPIGNPATDDSALSPLTVEHSAATMSQLILPSDANPMGNVHGGTVLKLIDTAAGVVAWRHARGPIVTARLDEMSFLQPVFIGNLVTVKASVNAVWRASMEVGVRVEAEDLNSGNVWHVASAYLILVGIDRESRPRPLPPLSARTAVEQRRQREAQERRDLRDARRAALEQRAQAGSANR